MTANDSHHSLHARTAGQFATTHWSVVLAAGQGDSPRARQALEQLCRTYWYPLYAYLRRTGQSVENAEDLVQGFFLHLMKREILASVSREGGRFRSFLLGTLKHFVSDQKDKDTAQKRGGGQPFVSWELAQAEQQFLHEPVDNQSADRIYERRWALTLLGRALERLREQCTDENKADLFAQLKGFVTGEKGPMSYAEAAAQLGLSVCALKSTIFRLRRRYQALVREEVSHTVSHPDEIEEELRYLLTVFS